MNELIIVYSQQWTTTQNQKINKEYKSQTLATRFLNQ